MKQTNKLIQFWLKMAAPENSYSDDGLVLNRC